MEKEIQQGLTEIERFYGVRILYAIESGSRMWGFASYDSDWDVRFIYTSAPSTYLTLEPQADTINNTPFNVKGVLDFDGWDLRKALYLFKRSNPSLVEWLKSPMVYRAPQYPVIEMQNILRVYFNPRAAIEHYLHMAVGNYRAYLQAPEVRLKKYFYVIRPLLCCRAIQETHTEPPVRFADLLPYTSKDAAFPMEEVMDLWQRKMRGDELHTGKRIDPINTWIENTIDYIMPRTHKVLTPTKGERLPPLDQLFFNTVLAWHVKGVDA